MSIRDPKYPKYTFQNVWYFAFIPRQLKNTICFLLIVFFLVFPDVFRYRPWTRSPLTTTGFWLPKIPGIPWRQVSEDFPTGTRPRRRRGRVGSDVSRKWHRSVFFCVFGWCWFNYIMTRWFQLFCFFHPEPWGRWTHFDVRIFFKGVGSTTNYLIYGLGWWFVILRPLSNNSLVDGCNLMECRLMSLCWFFWYWRGSPVLYLFLPR